ncbi:hypothetical protein MMC25_007366 [Agyrium rufum]|nr:hypothetical protein [Agyrium rufum]
MKRRLIESRRTPHEEPETETEAEDIPTTDCSETESNEGSHEEHETELGNDKSEIEIKDEDAPKVECSEAKSNKGSTSGPRLDPSFKYTQATVYNSRELKSQKTLEPQASGYREPQRSASLNLDEPSVAQAVRASLKRSNDTLEYNWPISKRRAIKVSGSNDEESDDWEADDELSDYGERDDCVTDDGEPNAEGLRWIKEGWGSMSATLLDPDTRDEYLQCIDRDVTEAIADKTAEELKHAVMCLLQAQKFPRWILHQTTRTLVNSALVYPKDPDTKDNWMIKYQV